MRLLAIDLGMSNTVAMIRDGDEPARALHFDGSPLLPSAVFVDEDGLIIAGREAVQRGWRDPAGYEPNPKRRIDDGEAFLSGTVVSVPDLLAPVLGAAFSAAVRELGGPPDEVRLTHPAAWAAQRLSVLVAAARSAGIARPQLIAEPVAAAGYLTGVLEAEVPQFRCVAVYRLGGGTFDAAVLERSPGGFDVLAAQTLPHVGGDDVDHAIVEHLRRSYPRHFRAWGALTAPASIADRRLRKTLYDNVRAAKERLSRESSAEVFVPAVGEEALLTRDELDELIRPLVDQTVVALRDAVAAAGVRHADLGAVILAGGSSRLSLVARSVHRALGLGPIATEQPELIAAEGALTPGAAPAVPAGTEPPGVHLDAGAPELKVVLLGDGAAGKTSLVAALCGEPFEHRDATHGIEVRELALPWPGGGAAVTLRLWDFGGQAIYRNTHQFFQTGGALYLVVWSAREEHRRDLLHDWLRRLRGRLGAAARVLLVATHCDQFYAEFDDSLVEEFPQLLAGQFAVDNATGTGLDALRDAIGRQASALAVPAVPARWQGARDAVAALAAHEPQISLERFAQVCRDDGLDEVETEWLLERLHASGHLLHHHDDEVLRDVVVLDPEWLSKTIGTAVNDREVRRLDGVLEHARLGEIWRPAFTGRHPRSAYLLRLMEKFDLSYRIDEHRSLIPQLLPARPPALPWTERDAPADGLTQLRCRFRFAEPVDGLMAALTVRLHAYSRGLHWRSGLFLTYPTAAERATALLTMSGRRELLLHVRAPAPALFFHTVIGAVETYLAQRWPNLPHERFADATGEALADELRGLRSDVREMHRAVRLVLAFTTQPIPDCPRLFTLTRADAEGLARAAVHRDTFRLTLWCEAPSRWHPHTSTTFQQVKPWAVKVQRYAGIVFTALRQAVPVVGAASGLLVDDPATLERINKELALVSALLPDLPRLDPAQAGRDAGGPPRPLDEVELAEVRDFLLERCPSGFGDLRRAPAGTGEYLWLCPEHHRRLDPGLPRVA